MKNKTVTPEFYNKKGVRVAGLADIPSEFATKFIELPDGLRYEKQKDGTYKEVGKAKGVKNVQD